jgi:hypothetical protein
MITQTCCLCLPDLVSEKCQYLVDFLDFVRHRSVFDMFAAFLESDEKAHVIQEWFKSINFPDLVLTKLRAITHPEADFGQSIALLRLVQLMVRCCTLEDSVKTTSALTTILEFPESGTAILNAQWSAILAICRASDPPITPIVERLPYMLELLQSNLRDGFFSLYQVCIIDIFTKTLHVDSVREILVLQNFPTMIAGLLRGFPQHTVLHSVIVHFVIESVKYCDLVEQILDSVLPIGVEYLTTSDVVERRTFGWNFILELKKSFSVLGGQLEGMVMRHSVMDASVWMEFDRINKIADAEYGGKTPSVEDEPSNMNMEQVLLMLRLLTSKH